MIDPRWPHEEIYLAIVDNREIKSEDKGGRRIERDLRFGQRRCTIKLRGLES